MKLFHDTRKKAYREPFGAVVTGTEVSLSLDVNGQTPESVTLMLWRGETANPQYISMTEMSCGTDDGSLRYNAVITAPDEGCLLWYAFAVETEDENDREVFYYGSDTSTEGGAGCMYRSDTERFQITVYKKAEAPSWYKEGIVYQIFPDRFARDDGWEERCEEVIRAHNARPAGAKRILEKDWERKAYYVRDDAGRVTGWPIYGGSFRGIEDKLDYLRSLGVSAIYLNPVFRATSNHRYDTADYMQPDPALGTEEEFRSLASAARERGIRIILDGVFSHTGADSRYFDRFGNFEAETGGKGAYLHEDSPYRCWYDFDSDQACGYRAWWGVDDLPEVNETEESFRELITGENGVIAHWMELGASGWRLDVADELPDSFIRDIRHRVKACDPDGLLIGEVWEDASNKISYGSRRRYFMGDELDGVMNYPLRTALLDYINYTISGGRAADLMMTLAENYPPENLAAGLDLIGSHDRERVLTAMAAAEDRKSAVLKVKLLSAIQYCLPGVPCIYYGDEAGLEGGPDPENRGAFPWGSEDKDLGYHYRMLGLLFREHPALAGGSFELLPEDCDISDDILAFIRKDDDEKLLILANRSYGPAEVDLRDVPEIGGTYALELLESRRLGISGRGFDSVIKMGPLSCMIICIRDELPEHQDLGHKAGVICHISSIPGGTFGKPARDMIDYISSAGMEVWQVLPLCPAGSGGSPYSSKSSFALEPSFLDHSEIPDLSGYEDFCRENMDWLCEYLAYTLVSEIEGGKPWSDWPDEYKNGEPQAILEKLSGSHGQRIIELATEQYYLDTQWRELREYAHGKGVSMMGDLPIYMAEDSADVWGNKDAFLLDSEGRMTQRAGVPPDAFSDEGQDWNNPLYDWESLAGSGYGWWKRRIRQCALRYDIMRLDHFRGFSEYCAIPRGKKPVDGSWMRGPGIRFFREIFAMLRSEGLDMKILAEDLGFLDNGVKNLLALSGLPGMDIWQFTAAEMLAMSSEKASNRVFYTGTHDNDTLAGFVSTVREKKAAEAAEKAAVAAATESSGAVADTTAVTGGTAAPDDEAAPADTQEAVASKAADTEKTIDEEVFDIIEKIYKSPAALAMVQMQDMFALGTEARMNVPGVPDGNWKWKIDGESIEDAFPEAAERAAWFRQLAIRSGRTSAADATAESTSGEAADHE